MSNFKPRKRVGSSNTLQTHLLALRACITEHAIVYGAFVGLGFAISESSFYVPFTLHVIPRITHRELFGQEAIRAVLRFLTGGIAGFGIGLARCRIHGWKLLFTTWLAAAMLIHFTWDYACGLNAANGSDAEVFRRTAAVGLMIVAMILFRIAVGICSRWSVALANPDDRNHREL